MSPVFYSILLALLAPSAVQVTCLGPELFSAASWLLSRPQIQKSTATFVERAGYTAEVYNVPSGQRGYVINLVRIVNPLIRAGQVRKKWPVLFIHGLVGNANGWLVMGYKRGKPHDWSHYDEAELDEGQLGAIVGRDRTSRSMPFLMSNFGYDVWLMNRRNTRDSRAVSPKWFVPMGNSTSGRATSSRSRLRKLFQALRSRAGRRKKRAIKLSKLDPINIWHNLAGETMGEKVYNFMTKIVARFSDIAYFNYSYDEQAEFDVPSMVDFIREQTQFPKVDIVGHSAGGLLTVMSLVARPEMNYKSKFDPKVNHAALLAPAINLHYNSLKSAFFQIFEGFELFFSTSIGTINGFEFILAATLLSMVPCLEDRSRGNACQMSLDEALGLGTRQWDLAVAYGTLLQYTDDSALHEFGQLIQSGQKNQIYYNDYRDPEKNALVYGSLNVPKYNLTSVALNSMSIWQGNTDRLVNQFDTYTLLQGLKNAWDYHFVGDASKQLFFNHLAFLLYEDVTHALNIPLLKRIALARHSDIHDYS